ncbi:MAG: hypothetical protein AB7S36_14180 [Planctomycetota bacterium]
MSIRMRAPRRLFPLPGLTLLTLVLLLLSGAQQVFAQPAGGDNTPAADDSANAQTSPSVGAAPDNTPPTRPPACARCSRWSPAVERNRLLHTPTPLRRPRVPAPVSLLRPPPTSRSSTTS